MNKIKLGTIKYLIAAASLLPVAKSANAENNNSGNYKLTDNDKYTLIIKAGPTFVLPSYIINSQINGKDMTGYNGGGFVELGVAKWLGEQGCSGKAEVLLDFSGRIDIMHMNSRAAAVYDANNAFYLSNGHYSTMYADGFGYRNRNDVIGTLNIGAGVGGHGVTVSANGGIGWHFDDGGNFGPVISGGLGLGVRLNDHMQIGANYRCMIFPYENLGGRSLPVTTVPLRNLFELGFVYKLKAQENTKTK